MINLNTPTDPRCRVCEATGDLLCVTGFGYAANSTVVNYRCPACGLVFVGNVLTNDDLAAAYAGLNETEYYAEVGATARAKFETAQRELLRLGIGHDEKILDIGTGNGDFLVLLQEAGFQNLAAHEIPSANTSRLEARHIPVYRDFDYASLPDASFDVVTMMDVMEHVARPKLVAETVFRVLKPGGLWYFHTPCVTPLDRTMHLLQRIPGLSSLGKAWQRSRTSIYHLQNYSTPSILKLAADVGFETPSVARRNELSWPLWRYADIYLCRPLGLPSFWSGLMQWFLAPLIANPLLNPNKAIAAIRKPLTPRATAIPREPTSGTRRRAAIVDAA